MSCLCCRSGTQTSSCIMKLLFDQNISFRVVKGLETILPLAKQIRELNLENSTDREIWEYAKREGYTIVTFDSDFYDLTLILGIPPKVVWLRYGNASTNHLIKILKENQSIITEFIENPDYREIGCLELNKNIFEE
jgi:predicted nuclease of predicted toxin-antitoxin system